MELLYLRIVLMYENQEQNSYIKPIDEPIDFSTDCSGTTKETGDWFKIEFVSMTEEEFNNLPEFTGF